MNICMFFGRLATDPKFGRTSKNESYVNFSLAVDQPGVVDDNGNSVATFLNVTAFKTIAERFEKLNFAKGDPLIIRASFRTHTYTGNDNVVHETGQFIMYDFTLTESKGAKEARRQASAQRAGQPSYAPYAGPETQYQNNAQYGNPQSGQSQLSQYRGNQASQYQNPPQYQNQPVQQSAGRQYEPAQGAQYQKQQTQYGRNQGAEYQNYQGAGYQNGNPKGGQNQPSQYGSQAPQYQNQPVQHSVGQPQAGPFDAGDPVQPIVPGSGIMDSFDEELPFN